ncbi:MAG: DUF4159 domain-containing protein [Candidatus Latescibacteria bacterium]|jgi:hypothetical protein|nr:DUF4159 domain-containing protein [Candidatus Latescibacterota bacterium]
MKKYKYIKSFSDIIDIKKLERESYRYLYLGFVIAILFHALGAVYWKFEISVKTVMIADRKTYEQIPVDIIILPPRIINPYETWKRIIKKRMFAGRQFKTIQPGMIHVEPFAQERYDKFRLKLWNEFLARRDNLSKDFQEDFDMLADAVLDSLLYSELPDSIKAIIDPESFTIMRLHTDLTISREPEDNFSLEEEMVTLDDIDELGMYKGVVIVDPDDKQNIKGFVYIPKYVVESRLRRSTGAPPEWSGGGGSRGINSKGSYNLDGAINGLAEAVNYYTGLKVKVERPISLASSELFEYPLVYLTSNHEFKLSPFHIKNFSEYLRKGGFAIIENGTPWLDYTPAEVSLLNVFIQAVGMDAIIEPIPHTHPIYHCFFDFENLIPEGADKYYGQPLEFGVRTYTGAPIPAVTDLRIKMSMKQYYLWGAWIEGRLIAVYSGKGYGHYWWEGVLTKYSDSYSRENTEYNFNPQLKIGVNMIMFALQQKNGITKKVVDYNAYRFKKNEKSQ